GIRQAGRAPQSRGDLLSPFRGRGAQRVSTRPAPIDRFGHRWRLLSFGTDVELVEIEVEAGAHLIGRDAEMPLQFVSDAAVLTARIAVQVALKAVAQLRRQFLAAPAV